MIKKFFVACALSLGLLGGATQANAQAIEYEVGHITVWGTPETNDSSFISATFLGGNYNSADQTCQEVWDVAFWKVKLVRAKCHSAGNVLASSSAQMRQDAATAMAAASFTNLQLLAGYVNGQQFTIMWGDGSIQDWTVTNSPQPVNEPSGGTGTYNGDPGSCAVG